MTPPLFFCKYSVGIGKNIMARKPAEKKYKHYNKLTCYEDFVDYCFRRLGSPVINIEITPEQAFDRISDALQYFLEYDLESVSETFFLHKIGAEDVKNGYLTIPMDVLDVMEVLTPGIGGALQTDANGHYDTSVYSFGCWENPTWNWFNNCYWSAGIGFAGSQSLFYYEVSMQYIQLLRTLLTAKTEFLYRRRQRKLWFLSKSYTEGEFVGLYVTKMLDPEKDDCIWESDFLKSYATCLLGLQWGQNLSKFGNVPSAGGLTINGDEIRQRYAEMKKELEEEHELKFREPPMPFFCN